MNVDLDQLKEEKPEFISPFNKLNFFSTEINWSDMNKEINDIDWSTDLSNLQPNEILSKITDSFLEICNRYVPTKKTVQKTLEPKFQEKGDV